MLPTERLALGVGKASVAADVSKAAIYRAMAAGELPYAIVAGRRKIMLDDLKSWVRGERVA